MNPEENDQFERMRLVGQIERAHELVGKYIEGLRFFVNQVGELNHELGRIDERLGG